jgi:hypothetical protein
VLEPDETVAQPTTPEVVKTLVDNHRRFLAFLERRVGSREVAEDILQDAFVRGLAGAGAAARRGLGRGLVLPHAPAMHSPTTGGAAPPSSAPPIARRTRARRPLPLPTPSCSTPCAAA